MQYKQYEKSMLVYRARKKNNANSSKYDSNINNKTHNLRDIHKNLAQGAKKQKFLIQQRSSLLLTQQKQQPRQSTSINKKFNHRSLHQLNPHNDATSQKKSQNQIKQLKKKYYQNVETKPRYSQQQEFINKKSTNNKSRYNLSVESLIEDQKHNKRLQSQNKQIKDKEKSINFYINIEKLKNLKISSRIGKVEEGFASNGPNSYLMKKPTHHISLDKRSLILKNSQKSKSRFMNSSLENIKSSINAKTIMKRKQPDVKPKIRYKTHQNQIEEQTAQIVNPRSHASQYLIPKKSNFRKHQLRDKQFIDGYLKGKQLGRGGFSKVWQAFHFSTKQFYAVKQIDTTNKYQTHITQIWFGNYFFESNGKIKSQFQSHPGSYRLLKMFQYSIVDPRAFIVYQTCDGSLGNMLYDIYEQDLPDEEDIDDDQKMYMIKYKNLYGQLRKNCQFLKHFIRSIAQALDLLANNKIVHSDIKTQNILIKKTDSVTKYEFKLIDYGSSFVFESLKQYKLATPEYMCPQLLNYILFENKKSCHQYMLEYVKVYENISAIDVWGLGCIVIQLIHGLPLWLNNPTKIFVNGKYQTKKGLFAVSDRSFSKILERQLSIVNNFNQFLTNQNNSRIVVDQEIKSVIRGMLNPNPKHRIRPHQIIQKLR